MREASDRADVHVCRRGHVSEGGVGGTHHGRHVCGMSSVTRSEWEVCLWVGGRRGVLSKDAERSRVCRSRVRREGGR